MSFLDPQPGGGVSAAGSVGSPAPSTGSMTPLPDPAFADNSPAKKRKRDANAVVFSQPGLTGYGTEVNTNMTFVIEYLRGKAGESKTVENIINWLSLHRQPDSHKEALVRAMRINPRMEWTPDPELKEQRWDSGTYKHRPVIPGVRDEDSLLSLLQKLTDASGVSVKELKDGWPDCAETLNSLESRHLIRIVRSKNDDRIWADDPSLCHDDIDPEFRSMWLRVSVPPPDEIVRKLLAAGLKPASEDPRLAQAAGPAKPKPQKKRAARKTAKTTNAHMEALLASWEAAKK